MENTFDYQSVPHNYTHCFNSQCAKSDECLRHWVGKNCTALHFTIQIINPNCIPAGTPTCPYFQNKQKVRMAWGLRHTFDNLPYKNANEIRRQIVAHFGKTLYYRFYRQERPLMPEDQAYIRRVFKQNGIAEEPEFERYTDEYNY